MMVCYLQTGCGKRSVLSCGLLLISELQLFNTDFMKSCREHLMASYCFKDLTKTSEALNGCKSQ